MLRIKLESTDNEHQITCSFFDSVRTNQQGRSCLQCASWISRGSGLVCCCLKRKKWHSSNFCKGSIDYGKLDAWKYFIFSKRNNLLFENKMYYFLLQISFLNCAVWILRVDLIWFGAGSLRGYLLTMWAHRLNLWLSVLLYVKWVQSYRIED